MRKIIVMEYVATIFTEIICWNRKK